MDNLETIKSVIPDGRGRIALGNLAKGVSKFEVYRDVDTDRIILEPFVDIPKSEAWLFKNKESLESVRKGLKESAEGKVKRINLEDLD